MLGAPALRRTNLRRYLEAFYRLPEVLLVGEAPSWRGCRFSGVPFTSEAQLVDGSLPFEGERTSRRRRPLAEPSGTVVWRVLRPRSPRFLLWNVSPLHPHRPGAPLANRRPRVTEVRRFHGLLGRVMGALGPAAVAAVGRTAQAALGELDVRCRYARHPAQGGAEPFRRRWRICSTPTSPV